MEKHWNMLKLSTGSLLFHLFLAKDLILVEKAFVSQVQTEVFAFHWTFSLLGHLLPKMLTIFLHNKG